MLNQFIYPMRIHVEDTDYGGVAYHANYLKYYERARSEWADAKGRGVEWQQAKGIYFPVRYARIDYLKPARLHQKVEVVTMIKEVRIASIVYDQYLRLADGTATILSKAEIKVACVDKNFRPVPLPEECRE